MNSLSILILHIIILIFVLLSCTISVIVLILSFIFLRPTRLSLPILLTCNTYVTIVILSCTLVNIEAHSIYGYFYPAISFENRLCEILGYFTHVAFCAFYYSFVLQAIFRLFRIIFYENKVLQSFTIFIVGIIIQWLLSFALILSDFLLHDFQYVPDQYNCLIGLKNTRGLASVAFIIYGCSLLFVCLMYGFSFGYIRRLNPNQRRRQKSNKRDELMLKRVTILLLIQLAMSIPTVIIFVIYIITNNLLKWVYLVQFMHISVILLFTSVILVFLTPKMRNIFRKNRRVLPMITIMTTRPFLIETGRL
ncbi:unnamed protein product [Rotaria magnacalcarata]|uniref:G-protein coupled receptors family 1 profile domain-containing protein n=2 Tax=Rotaria magnacalcarata TaxID=392030 RepID=A0A814ZWY6_9BILA|nr:unnamed protein product [Rotaria magnacalcarata]CAF1490782.1 unnamed protein product [Rotaria magnacalcarata]CAF2092916.1 unnamed protein product [Rotaria magnacalcarata]CAF4259399.1 unnamed protein product [Rotaria magnacalcarata]CAF4788220.1 unnamed protein product [Rotaria magnacalcarata]